MEEQYQKRLKNASTAYKQLVIACAAVMAAAIIVAITANILLGASLAIFCAGVYLYFSTEEIYKQLGLKYTHEEGSLHIKKAVAKYGDTLFIPSRLLWADVTHIDDGALSSEKNAELNRVFLSKNITHIGADVFGDHSPRIEIYYEGSEEEFSRIDGASSLVCGAVRFNCPFPEPPSKKETKNADREERSADTHTESEK